MTKKGLLLLPFFLIGCMASSTGQEMKETHEFTKFSSKYKLCTVVWLKIVDSNNMVLGIDMAKIKDNDPAMAWLTLFCGTTSLYLSNLSDGEPMTVWAVPSTNKSNNIKNNCFFCVKGVWKGTDMWLKLEETKTNIYDLFFSMKKIHSECYNERVRRQ